MGFDPYEQWLGIPPGPRPPNYYDLLGLPSDEPDLQRFHEASRDRYSRVQTYVLSPLRQQAQELLGLIGQAVSCLTDPRRRDHYDAEQVRRHIQSWLTGSVEPGDFYDLLGKEYFPRRREPLLRALTTAQAALEKPSKDNPDAQRRAKRLRDQLDLAIKAVTDRQAFLEYHRPLLAEWREEYAGDHKDDASVSDADRVRQWLLRSKRTHPAQIDLVVRAVMAGDPQSRDFGLAALFPEATGETRAGGATRSDVAGVEQAAPQALLVESAEPVAKEAAPDRKPTAARSGQKPRIPPAMAIGGGVVLAAIILAILIPFLGKSAGPGKSQASAKKPQEVPSAGTSDRDDAPLDETPAGTKEDDKAATAGSSSAETAPKPEPPQPKQPPEPSEPANREPSKPLAPVDPWTGKLHRLVRHQGELHLLVIGDNDRYEPVTEQTDFLDQISDYRSLMECGVGDEVSIWVSERSDIASRFRLDPNARLLELRRIQRKDDPASLAVVGERVRSARRDNPDLTELAGLLYARPPIGQRVECSAYLCTEVPTVGLFFVAPDRGRFGYRVSGSLASSAGSSEASAATAIPIGTKVRLEGTVEESSPERFTLGNCRVTSETPLPAPIAKTTPTPVAPPVMEPPVTEPAPATPTPPVTPPPGSPPDPFADLPTAQPADRLLGMKGHQRGVRAIAWKPYDEEFVSAGDDGQLMLWDVDNGGQQPQKLPYTGPPLRAIAWSNIRGLALGAVNGSIDIADPSGAAFVAGPRRATVPLCPGLTTLAWDDNGIRLAVGVSTGGKGSRMLGGRSKLADNVFIFRPEPYSTSVPGHFACSQGAVTALAWHPRQSDLLAVGDDQGVIWVLNVGAAVFPVCGRAEKESDARRFLGVVFGRGKNMPSARTPIVEGLGDHCYHMAWSPDGDRLAAVCQTVELWDFAATQGFRRATVNLDEVARPPMSWRAAAWHSDGNLLALGGFRVKTAGGGRVVVYDVQAGAAVAVLPCPGNVTDVAFHRYGRYLVAGCDDGTVLAWKWPIASVSNLPRGSVPSRRARAPFPAPGNPQP